MATYKIADPDEKDKKQDKVKALEKALCAEYPNIWQRGGPAERATIFAFAEEYKKLISAAKTEREFVTYAVEMLENIGFRPLTGDMPLKAGDKVYQSIRGKGLAAAVVGRQPIADGINLVGAHIDSPRLDLKPNPVYEDSDMVFLKTHYYGGIKKYQWATIPLALHGIVFLADGSPLALNIGEAPDEPVLTITDLLPHLGSEQMARKASDVIKGEDLNVLVGGLPLPDQDNAGHFKLALLQLLHDRYGIVEKDFVSAEIEIVPAGPARDVGLDASFIGAYGQDDRSCAYPALAALADLEDPAKTVVCFLYDKEEIGSEGNTGAQSKSYEYFLLDLYQRCDPGASQLGFAQLLEKCQMLSADVTNGFDPTFASVSDSHNNCYLSRGIGLVKYTGARGKSGSSEARSEFVARITRLFQANDVPWQTGELGKVDAGGGGTIAKYLANLGMDVIDCGVPVLSMHAPFEVTSKADIYFTYLAYKVFLANI